MFTQASEAINKPINEIKSAIHTFLLYFIHNSLFSYLFLFRTSFNLIQQEMKALQ